MQIQATTFESGDMNRQTFEDNYGTDLNKLNCSRHVVPEEIQSGQIPEGETVVATAGGEEITVTRTGDSVTVTRFAL